MEEKGSEDILELHRKFAEKVDRYPELQSDTGISPELELEEARRLLDSHRRRLDSLKAGKAEAVRHYDDEIKRCSNIVDELKTVLDSAEQAMKKPGPAKKPAKKATSKTKGRKKAKRKTSAKKKKARKKRS